MLADAKVSKEFYSLPGGPLAVALGIEARSERLDNTLTPLFTSGDVLGAGGAHQSVSGSRSEQAFYAEASVPFAKGVEMQLAARYDPYSDFGGTANPKAARRWQTVPSLMLRSSRRYQAGSGALSRYRAATGLRGQLSGRDRRQPGPQA